MRVDEFEALGVTTDLETAARALGVGRGTAYRLAQAGEFPCRVIRVGGRWVVPTVGLRDLVMAPA